MKIVFGILAVFALVSISVCLYTCNQVKENVTDNAFVRYEEYQEIYNTCQQINTDLCNIRSVDTKDPMFEQFSKQQRIVGLQSKMNRWVEEYNAKSKMWNRAMWKSDKLPYQLSTNDFSCYNPPK